VHLPYVGHGSAAYHARRLDEEVINPFLKEKEIPSSKGPFLSVFRRAVRFDTSIRQGLKDKTVYDSFLVLVDDIAEADKDTDLQDMLRVVLAEFILLREKSHVAVARVQRASLPQIIALMNELLRIPSGGRFPVFLVVATFRALSATFNLGWVVQYQGINVADAASGEAGDITIKRGDITLMAAEVTERVVEKSRVVSTFTAKIAPLGIQDYLFFVREAHPDAYNQAHQYFSQGHEVNFLNIKQCIGDILAAIGAPGRSLFIRELIELLDQPDVPREMKVGWNESILRLTKI
jgi:hypothetical protein